MTGLAGYARTFFHGGDYAPPRLPTFDDEVERWMLPGANWMEPNAIARAIM